MKKVPSAGNYAISAQETLVLDCIELGGFWLIHSYNPVWWISELLKWRRG
jgi:hypothetical protein